MRCVAPLALAAFSVCTFGQPEAPPAPPPPPSAEAAETSGHPWHGDERWTMRFEPSVWWMGVGGDIQLPRESAGESNSINLRDLDMNSNSTLTPTAELNLRKGRWGVAVRGFAYSEDATTSSTFSANIGDLSVTPGDLLASSLDLMSFEIEGTYRLAPDALHALPGKARLRPRLDLVFGVRVLDADWRIAAGGTTSLPAGVEEAEELAAHPLIGLKGSIELYDTFSIDAKLDVGWLPLGDSSSYGLDILVGGTWKPHPNLGVQLGYRSLFFGLSSGDGEAEFEFDGTSQGLYAGIVFEF